MHTDFEIIIQQQGSGSRQKHASAHTNKYPGRFRLVLEHVIRPKKESDAEIPGYAFINLVADCKVSNGMKVNFRVNNVLNKDYALAYEKNPKTDGFAYQTPGASFFINLRYEPE